MEVLFELEPVGSRAKLLGRVRELVDLVDWIDVPDSPMGRSRFPSPIVSCVIKNLFEDTRVIAHLRVIDVSRVALEATLRGLELCNVERVTFVRGDVIEGSSVVRDVEPEEAVRIARSSTKVKPGLTLSLRKSLEEIEGRLRVGAEFYLVLNLNKDSVEKMEATSRVARKLNIKLYPYVVLITDANRDRILGVMERWKLHDFNEALELVEASNDVADGILVSSPMDFKGGLELVRRLRRR
jgi:5,10-methylenetetrahydrofolate reductase